eukprot:535904-Rhodomonas_salina.1
MTTAPVGNLKEGRVHGVNTAKQSKLNSDTNTPVGMTVVLREAQARFAFPFPTVPPPSRDSRIGAPVQSCQSCRKLGERVVADNLRLQESGCSCFAVHLSEAADADCPRASRCTTLFACRSLTNVVHSRSLVCLRYNQDLTVGCAALAQK